MWLRLFVEGEDEKHFIKRYLKKEEVFEGIKVDYFSLGLENKSTYKSIQSFINQKTKHYDSDSYHKRVAIHSSVPIDIIFIDKDLFKDRINLSKNNYFFSDPCFEKYLLALFKQKTTVKNHKKTFKKFIEKKYKLKYKSTNLRKIVDIACRKRLFSELEEQNFAFNSMIKFILKHKEERQKKYKNKNQSNNDKNTKHR